MYFLNIPTSGKCLKSGISGTNWQWYQHSKSKNDEKATANFQQMMKAPCKITLFLILWSRQETMDINYANYFICYVAWSNSAKDLSLSLLIVFRTKYQSEPLLSSEFKRMRGKTDMLMCAVMNTPESNFSKSTMIWWVAISRITTPL